MQVFHGPNDDVIKKVYSGPDYDQMFDQMDTDQQEMRQKGYRMVKRVKVGRNANCPCGSGKKFKKCCISRAINGRLDIQKT